jgi:methyl-accepting chemotaxis protein
VIVLLVGSLVAGLGVAFLVARGIRRDVVQVLATVGSLRDKCIAGLGGHGRVGQRMASTPDEAGRAVGEIASALGDVAQGAESQVRRTEWAKLSSEEIARAMAVHARVGDISTAIARIAASSGQMQQDMSEVAAVAEQSSASAEEVSASTEETSAATEEIAASAQHLSDRAEELEHLVGRFTLARG